MATTALGRLTLDLAVRMSEFSDGLTRAQRETEDATRQMGESVTDFKDTLLESLSGSPIGGAIDGLTSRLGSITNAFGSGGLAGAAKVGGIAIAGAFVGATAAIVSMALETAEADRQLERLAKRGNTSTANLQILAAAAASYGLEMEGVGDILADAQEKLGEFSATGGGGLMDTLELMGKYTKMTEAELEQFGRGLSTMDSVDAIQAVVDKMEAAGATTQEVRFVTESLASGLGDIIPLWDESGAALSKYEEELNRAGVIRTKESMEQSKILANQINLTTLKMDGLKNQLVTATLPALSGLVDYMSGATDASKTAGNNLAGVGSIANGVAKFIIGLSTTFQILGKSIAATAVNMMSFFKLGFNAVTDPMGIFSHIERYREDVSNVWGFLADDIHNALMAGGAAIDRIENPIKLAAGAGNNLNSKLTTAPSNIEADKDKAGSKGAKGAKSTEIITNKAVADAILAGAKKLGVNPNDLAAVISFETGGSFKTSAKNPTSSATGLIQFMEASDGKKDGKYYGHTRNEFASLSPARQMEYVVKYLEGRGIKAGSGVGSIYDAVAGYGYKKGTKAYSLNKVWDTNGDGYVAKGEAVKSSRFKSHIRPYFKDGEAIGQANEMSVLDSEAKTEQARLEQEAKDLATRTATGNKMIFDTLSKTTQIEQQRVADIEAATKALFDKPEELSKVITDINLNAKAETDELKNSILSSLGSEADQLSIVRDKEIAKGIEAFGAGTVEALQAEGIAIMKYYDSMDKLTENTLLPFMTDLQKLDLEKKRDIADIVRIHGEGSATANQAIGFIEANYQKAKTEIEWLMGESARQRDILANTIGVSTKQSTDYLEDSQAKRSMNPEDYEQFSASKSWENGRLDQQTNYENREKDINSVDKDGKDVYEDKEELLRLAHAEHLAKMAVLDEDYANKTTSLAEASAMAKLTIAQTNTNALGTLAGAVFGQQSTAAKAVFAMEKGLALQRIFLESKVALSKAWSSAAFPYNLPAVAMAALETGALASAVQTITPMFSGVAHGGMDYIPSESTFLLDKGERVLSPRQNKDLTNYLANGGSSGSSTGETNISINIDNNGNANMDSDNAAVVSKQMAIQVKNLVQSTLRQEKRQGGML